LEFGGNFGHATIDNFAAGAGSTHDSIRIALGVFGSYAALSSSMSQVGSDVVISLGATDSITLRSFRPISESDCSDWGFQARRVRGRSA